MVNMLIISRVHNYVLLIILMLFMHIYKATEATCILNI